MVSLYTDVSKVCFLPIRVLAEKRFGHAIIPIVAVQDVLEVLHAVDIMLALLRRDEQADMIPMVGWFRGVKFFACGWVNRWFVKSVNPAAPARVVGCGVVFQLAFGAGGADAILLVGAVVND